MRDLHAGAGRTHTGLESRAQAGVVRHSLQGLRPAPESIRLNEQAIDVMPYEFSEAAKIPTDDGNSCSESFQGHQWTGLNPLRRYREKIVLTQPRDDFTRWNGIAERNARIVAGQRLHFLLIRCVGGTLHNAVDIESRVHCGRRVERRDQDMQPFRAIQSTYERNPR